VSDGPPELAADELAEQQRNMLASPKRRYAIAARLLLIVHPKWS